jgi:hypothetical protein
LSAVVVAVETLVLVAVLVAAVLAVCARVRALLAKTLTR